MPEGPELHLSSRFVKKVGETWKFLGKIEERLPANRSPKLDDLNSRLSHTTCYTITSWSRGKELMLAIKPHDLPASEKYRPEDWSIRFNFGMTGCFQFTRTSEIPKHAKVCFTAVGKPPCTLSYVDMRGFGRWTPTSEWSDNRGPCILQEPDLFRAHVLGRLADRAFSKPICEVMLDQRYFNGVGNYLRAEALHRLGLRPFTCARDLLSPLPPELKPGSTDLLQQCHRLAAEVVALGGGKRYVPLDVLRQLAREGVQHVKMEEEDDDEEEADAFEEWLQCYYQPGMKNLVDHQGRTVWFAGDPGPMVPKARKQRHGTSPKKSKSSPKSENEEGQSDDEEYSPAKTRSKRAPGERSSAPRVKQQSSEMTGLEVKSTKSRSKKKGSVETGDNVAAVKNGELKKEKRSSLQKKVSPKKSHHSAKSRSRESEKLSPSVVSAKRKSSVNSARSSLSIAGERRSKRLSGNLRET